jgi:hypothetical protein
MSLVTNNVRVVVGHVLWSGSGETYDAKKLAVKRLAVEISLLVDEVVDECCEKFGVIVAPEYFWCNKNPIEKEDVEKFKVWLKSLAVEHPFIIFAPGTMYVKENDMVKNTFFACYNHFDSHSSKITEMLFEYHKRNDFNEVAGFVAGDVSEKNTFTINLGPHSQKCLSIGIEICLDHGMLEKGKSISSSAIANKYMLHPGILAEGVKVPLHIIVSNWISIGDEYIPSVVESGGILVHASTVFKNDNIPVVVPIKSDYGGENLQYSGTQQRFTKLDTSVSDEVCVKWDHA